jgi:hypothetical protein
MQWSGAEKGGEQGYMPPYECEFSIDFFKIQIKFENLIVLAPPKVQKINFLTPPGSDSIIVSCLCGSVRRSWVI